MDVSDILGRLLRTGGSNVPPPPLAAANSAPPPQLSAVAGGGGLETILAAISRQRGIDLSERDRQDVMRMVISRLSNVEAPPPEISPAAYPPPIGTQDLGNYSAEFTGISWSRITDNDDVDVYALPPPRRTVDVNIRSSDDDEELSPREVLALKEKDTGDRDTHRRSPPSSYSATANFDREKSNSQRQPPPPRPPLRAYSPPVFQGAVSNAAPFPKPAYAAVRRPTLMTSFEVGQQQQRSAPSGQQRFSRGVSLHVPRPLAETVPNAQILEFLRRTATEFRRIWRKNYRKQTVWNGYAYNFRSEARQQLAALCGGETTRAFDTLSIYMDNKLAMKIHTGANYSKLQKKRKKSSKRGEKINKKGVMGQQQEKNDEDRKMEKFDCHSGFDSDYRASKKDLDLLNEINDILV